MGAWLNLEMKRHINQLTGETYTGSKAYMKRVRPQLSFLESVPQLSQEVMDDDGSISRDSDFILDDMRQDDFTPTATILNRPEYGSPHEGKRLWFTVFLLPGIVAGHEIGRDAQG